MNITFLFFSKSLASTMGWIGTFAYLIAYFLLSINRLKAEKKLYHVLNVVGGMGLTCNALFLNDYPNVIVNVVWAAIALGAILLIVSRKQN
jgi:hypothetical protein